MSYKTLFYLERRQIAKTITERIEDEWRFRMLKYLRNKETNQIEKVMSDNIVISADEIIKAQSEILTVLKNHKLNYEVSEYLLECLITQLRESHKYEQITVL